MIDTFDRSRTCCHLCCAIVIVIVIVIVIATASCFLSELSTFPPHKSDSVIVFWQESSHRMQWRQRTNEIANCIRKTDASQLLNLCVFAVAMIGLEAGQTTAIMCIQLPFLCILDRTFLTQPLVIVSISAFCQLSVFWFAAFMVALVALIGIPVWKDSASLSPLLSHPALSHQFNFTGSCFHPSSAWLAPQTRSQIALGCIGRV